MSLRAIAGEPGGATSTESREVAANGGRSRYRASPADRQAWSRATRPKACKLAGNPVLLALVKDRLARRWSPQQIAGWLKFTHPDDPEMQASHESIYRTLYEAEQDDRGAHIGLPDRPKTPAVIPGSVDEQMEHERGHGVLRSRRLSAR